MWPFTARHFVPVKCSTDTIIPLHSRDDTAINSDVVMNFTFCFNDVLDPEKLSSALAKLMTLGDWRKLGARLRLNAAQRLEYHIPEAYTTFYRGFNFSHVELHCTIKEHPLGSQIPIATAKPSIYSDLKSLLPLIRDTNTPTKLDDYLYTDTPQLAMHVVSFTDSTLVTFSFLHTLSDAIGFAALLDAWVLMLNGKEIKVPPLTGFASDPFAGVSEEPKEDFKLKHKQLNGMAMLMFILRYAFEVLWYWKKEAKILCIPTATLSKIKSSVMSNMETSASGNNSVTLISDSELLIVCWTKLVV